MRFYFVLGCFKLVFICSIFYYIFLFFAFLVKLTFFTYSFSISLFNLGYLLIFVLEFLITVNWQHILQALRPGSITSSRNSVVM